MTAPSVPTWHATPEQLAAYLAGEGTALEGASVEQHLVRCARCRGALRPMTNSHDRADRGIDLDAGWLRLEAAVTRPALPWSLRFARRLGLGEPTAVVLRATTALRTAWFASAAVALVFALVCSHLTRDGSTLWPFLLVAPLVPVLGVATAYGPSTDPLEQLVATTSYGRGRLVLTRALAVVVSCLPPALLLGLALPGPTWVAVAWLGPALTMVTALLALASFTGPRPAAAVLSLLWGGAVLAATRWHAPTWPVEAERQLVFLAVAATSLLVLAARSHRTRRTGVAL